MLKPLLSSVSLECNVPQKQDSILCPAVIPYGVTACVRDAAVLMCNYDSKTVSNVDSLQVHIWNIVDVERTDHTAKSEIHKLYK